MVVWVNWFELVDGFVCVSVVCCWSFDFMIMLEIDIWGVKGEFIYVCGMWVNLFDSVFLCVEFLFFDGDDFE